MLKDMPVGIPFYLEKGPDGYFSHTLATDRKDYSDIAMDYLNYCAAEFKKPLRTIINGEKIVTVKGKKYKVDGHVKIQDQDYFVEFYGCR